MDALYDAVIGAVNIRQVSECSFSAGAQVDRQRVSGGLDASEIYLMSAEPRATWKTMDLAGVIAGISNLTGLDVAAGTITLPWNRRANGGTFAGGSNNFSLTSANGLTIPTGYSATQGDAAAMVDLETVFRSTNGILAPVAANVNQALAAQAYVGGYRLGPFYFGGSEIAEITSVRVNTGLKVEVFRYSGGIYPVKTVITSRDPSIDITFENADAMATLGPIFAAMSSCAAYFRKKSDGGTVVADASEVHCKFSFAAGITAVQQISGSGQANAPVTVRLEGKALTVSAASAIP